MAVDTPTLYRGLVGRLALVRGLREAEGVLGPGREPASIVHRSFSLVLGADIDAGERVRSGGTLAVWVSFLVMLAHRLRPKEGNEALLECYSDRDAVRQVLLAERDDVLAAVQHLIVYEGSDAPIIAGGGAYVLSMLRWRVLQHLALSVTL